MRLMLALRLSASLLLMLAPPTVLLASQSTEPASCSGGDGVCTAQGDRLLSAHHQASPKRRLLLSGWAEATSVREPLFFELVPIQDRKKFVFPECANRPEWRFMWPTSLSEFFTCDDYAKGAINNEYCQSDLGYDFQAGEWLPAQQACPVACGTCCDFGSFCKKNERVQDSTFCVVDCKTSGARVIEVGSQVLQVTDVYEKFLAFADTYGRTNLWWQAVIVKMTLWLPIPVSEFNKARQKLVGDSMPLAAGVDMSQVIIELTAEQRDGTFPGARINAEVVVKDRSAAKTAESKLTADNINAELARVGLPTAEVLSAAQAVLPEYFDMNTGVWSQFQKHKNGSNTLFTVNSTVHEVRQLAGASFLDEGEILVFSATPLSRVRHTLDGTTPSSTAGVESSRIRVASTATIRAAAYMPAETTRTLTGSGISSVNITVKATPPIITVVACHRDTGTLYFDAAHSYAGQACVTAEVMVKAGGSSLARAKDTRLRYAINREDPCEATGDGAAGASGGAGAGAGCQPLGQEMVLVTVVSPGLSRVSARAWRLGTLPSDVAVSRAILIQKNDGPTLEASDWMGTVGFWKFTRAYLSGTYSRPISSANDCRERMPTYIAPAAVSDTARLGNAVLRGPTCKGGEWDLSHDLSPNLARFIDESESAFGLKFDSLNRGLYVLDDISPLVMRDTFPRQTLSVEVALSIDFSERVAFLGIVGARLDGGTTGEGVAYGKGWSIGYALDPAQDTVTLIFSLAVAGAEAQPGMGGLKDVRAVLPRQRIARARQLVHVVCTYDGRCVLIVLQKKKCKENERN